jgi:hypothetical protein
MLSHSDIYYVEAVSKHMFGTRHYACMCGLSDSESHDLPNQLSQLATWLFLLSDWQKLRPRLRVCHKQQKLCQ